MINNVGGALAATDTGPALLAAEAPPTWAAGCPPADGNQYLINIGYPWAVVGVWNSLLGQFAYADLQVEPLPDENDTYFETDYIAPANIIGYLPLPIVPRLKYQTVGGALAATDTGPALVAAEAPPTTEGWAQ